MRASVSPTENESSSMLSSVRNGSTAMDPRTRRSVAEIPDWKASGRAITTSNNDAADTAANRIPRLVIRTETG
ncbi:MAG: hypothetical protein IPF53_09455 [Blastocatellia bacterium]|nr:hypothetical protein [Blastocatellia bacterium]